MPMSYMRKVNLKNLDNCLVIFGGLALAGLSLVHTPFNAGVDITIRYLAFPIFALVLFVAYASPKKNASSIGEVHLLDELEPALLPHRQCMRLSFRTWSGVSAAQDVALT